MKKILIIFFLLIVFAAVLSLILALAHKVPMGDRIALVRVEGVIMDSRDVIEELKEYSDDSAIKAVVIRVDSPGGGVVPAQEIYDEIKRIKSKKKVVVSMGSVAASGGYYIACPADRIVTNPGTLTGSIGVIMEVPNFEGLMNKIGIKTEVIKSGKHKDIVSVFKSIPPEERAILQAVLDDVHEQFIKAVAEGRNMKIEEIKKLADGRIFTGKNAKQLGLVDELGSLEDAIKLAGKISGIKGEPRVVTKKEKFSFLDIITGGFPKELIKDGFPTVRLKYMLTP
ncbi:MAG: signal peptide peptidase SppA [Nitrospirae bacterium]|nr:signal peptide peptidase SppA [Nitrospirota bacterium]